jgi:3-oxoacyl-[acyl-carrier-protein] synthase-3
VVADHLVRSSGQAILLIGANVLSRRVNPDDLTTAILFGDAAGAVVLGPTPTHGILASVGQSAGEHAMQLMIPAGGSRQPWHPDLTSADRFMQMPSGQNVFKLAVHSMLADSQEVMSRSGVETNDIDWLIPHQASQRIVSELGKRLMIPDQRVAWWLADYGNSSAATLPVALSLGRERGLIRSGQTILLAAAGAGFCSAASVLRA